MPDQGDPAPDVTLQTADGTMRRLADWPKPSKRDHITGMRQDLAERKADVAVDALKPVLAKAGKPKKRKVTGGAEAAE